MFVLIYKKKIHFPVFNQKCQWMCIVEIPEWSFPLSTPFQNFIKRTSSDNSLSVEIYASTFSNRFRNLRDMKYLIVFLAVLVLSINLASSQYMGSSQQSQTTYTNGFGRKTTQTETVQQGPYGQTVRQTTVTKNQQPYVG